MENGKHETGNGKPVIADLLAFRLSFLISGSRFRVSGFPSPFRVAEDGRRKRLRTFLVLAYIHPAILAANTATASSADFCR